MEKVSEEVLRNMKNEEYSKRKELIAIIIAIVVSVSLAYIVNDIFFMRIFFSIIAMSLGVAFIFIAAKRRSVIKKIDSLKR